MTDFIKPEVREMRAYHLADVPARIKLNQNENPFDLPPAVKARALQLLAEHPWSRYPEFVPHGFLERLGQSLDWPAEGLTVGNGSNELIAALLTVTLERGKKLLICEPTFSVYRQLGRLHAADVVSIALADDFQFDVSAILAGIDRQVPDAVILCSPNNPTGSWLELDQIEAIVQRSPGLIIVDEAYYEFCRISAAPLIKRYPNLAVTRTFSKAMALAGLRLGYLMGTTALVGEVNKGKLPYNLDIFSMIAGMCALDAADEMRRQVEVLVGERERLIEAMKAIDGVKAYPSRANFILFETRIEAERVYRELLERRGILIRNVSKPGRMERALRVSVGRPEENDEFLACLKEIVYESHAASQR